MPGSLILKTDDEKDKIGININYNKDFPENDGLIVLIEYLLENFRPMMLDADKVIRSLFGEPIDGGS